MAASILMLSAFAQTTDKKLLTGHWKFYYFSTSDYTIHIDSMKQSAAVRVKAAIALAKDHLLSEKDSAELVAKTYYQGRQIDSSYMEFNKDGTVAIQLSLPVDEGDTDLKKGRYSWTSDRQFIVYLGEDKLLFTIHKFTANALEIVANEEQDAAARISIKLRK